MLVKHTRGESTGLVNICLQCVQFVQLFSPRQGPTSMHLDWPTGAE